MDDGQPAASFFKRALAWFCVWAEAMEQTEASVLEARIARLEEKNSHADSAVPEKAGGSSKDHDV